MGRPENTMSTNDEVCTPEEIWRPIIETLGPIKLDPSSHPASTVPAEAQILLPKYWTDPNRPPPKEWQDGGDHDFIYGDGLKFKWGGVGLVFENPPYAELPDEPLWWEKFLREVDEGVIFFPVRPACAWFQRFVPQLSVLTLLESRVKHDNIFYKKDSKDGRHKAGEPVEEAAAFSQALGYVGDRQDLWLPTARKFGWTLELDRMPMPPEYLPL